MLNKQINFLEKIYYAFDELAYEIKIIGIRVENDDMNQIVYTEILFKFLEGEDKDKFERLSISHWDTIEKIGNELDIRLMGYELYKDSQQVKDNDQD